MKTLLLFTLAVLCTVAGAAFGQAVPQSMMTEKEALVKSEARSYASLMNAKSKPASDPNIDVKYYKLNITITTAPNYLRGTVTMKAVSSVSNLSSVTLDLMNTMIVDSVKVGATRLAFSQQPTTFTITLNRTYGNGELVTIDIYYRGVPVGDGLRFSSHGGVPWVYTFSQPYGARDWWPCKDHPLDKADSVDIWVTVGISNKVGSNGKLVAVIDNGNGTTTYKWAERYPISTELVSLATTNYAEFTNWFKYTPTDSMPVLNYVLPEHLATAQIDLPKTIDMLRIFSDKYSLYPFVMEKYGHAEFGWTGSALENQTMTSFGFSEEWVLAHELAHQ
ncbi:MAG: hypothetical protein HY961_06180 [Ignavibacteriae bacterium]|nr:hypothetical protein [Ignavibacteriota bacterium]